MLKRMIKISQIMSFKMTVKKMSFYPTLPSKIVPEYQEEKETQPPPPPTSVVPATQRRKAEGRAASDRRGGDQANTGGVQTLRTRSRVVPGRQQAQGLYTYWATLDRKTSTELLERAGD